MIITSPEVYVEAEHTEQITYYTVYKLVGMIIPDEDDAEFSLHAVKLEAYLQKKPSNSSFAADLSITP